MYLVPGMYHCHGGQGPSELDLLTPLMRWVESGQAADEIKVYQASRSGLPLSPKSRRAKTGRTGVPAGSPLPGRGAPRQRWQGERYTRGEPLTDTPTPAWRGADSPALPPARALSDGRLFPVMADVQAAL